MERFSIQKSDGQELLITLAPWWRVFDFMLFLACMLILDHEIKLRLGNAALLSKKLSFLARLAVDTLRQGVWLKNIFFLVPAGLMTACIADSGFDFHYHFDAGTNRAILTKSFFLIPLDRHEIPFESAKELCLAKRKDPKRSYRLILEEGSGKKITILESSRREKLWSVAKKIQEITNLPITQKIHS